MVQWLRLSASNVGVQVQKERERRRRSFTKGKSKPEREHMQLPQDLVCAWTTSAMQNGWMNGLKGEKER